MDKSLYIGMSGAKQNMLAQQAHANNLANVNTTGFKKDFAQARSMPVFGEHLPTRAHCSRPAATLMLPWKVTAGLPSRTSRARKF